MYREEEEGGDTVLIISVNTSKTEIDARRHRLFVWKDAETDLGMVQVNDPNSDSPLFSTGVIGGDNAVARHGIHGLYWLFNIDIPGKLLIPHRENAIYLTKVNAETVFPRGIIVPREKSDKEMAWELQAIMRQIADAMRDKAIEFCF
ncbi:hypothetical protein L1987_64140 [Smallanthus sonchifolius]|uniref:Uncharacterized protein n=1 Tax=Smallanthus sonchifolius TaxID=185202 RepID=A0ACB9CF98_9ASTR|nr:hypothetical protein L1987_64140 [Smallanthus sonchifolius]